MCGIAGQVNKSGQAVERKPFEAMTDCIAHRGPDARGTWYAQNLALGHRRLAILDLSADGVQPMHLLGRYSVVYNGEIYNYIELRDELREMGYTFETQTDTEVLVKAYDAWGEEAQARFNGMWAFAIYDAQKNELFFSRDRFGVKPFYYYENADVLVFASEIKQLLPFIPGGPRMNRERAMDFLLNALTEYDHTTFFEDVQQLRPGWNGVYDLQTNRLQLTRWYDLSAVEPSEQHYGEACLKFKTLFADAVRLRLRADVPVGACLSGGLDSTAIVCEAARLRKAQHAAAPVTISSCYREQAEMPYDEQEYIDAVVADTGVDSRKVYPTFEKTIADLDELLYHMDEPFGSMSICAQREVFADAQKSGRTVMLDGQGADEQLAGYSSFYAPAFYDLYKNGRFLALAREIRWFSRHRAETEGLRAKYYLYPILLRPAWRYVKRLVTRLRRRRIQPAHVQADVFIDKSAYKPKPLYPTVDFRAFTLDMIQVNLVALLHYEDRNSMTYSIESRVPFLDYRLVEHIFSLPSTYKLRAGVTKAVMRDALRGAMTEKVRRRYSKLGFAAPGSVWIRSNKPYFREELRKACEALSDIVDAQRMLARFDEDNAGQDDLVFRLIILAHWMHVFCVQQPKGE